MIFSRFFKGKWQHNNPTVRIEALDEFDLGDLKQRQTVLNMLAEDESDLVRKAALLKLNDFKTYLQVASDNSSKPLRTFANKVLTDAALKQNSPAFTLNQEQLNQFIEQCTDSKVLEQFLFASDDVKLVERLVARVNKPNIFHQLLIKTEVCDIASFALENLNDIHLLEKSVKRIKLDNVKALASNKVANLKHAAEKPEQLKKQVQLVLSKLLALKDERDFAVLERKLQQLRQQFADYQKEFNCLETQDTESITEKYHSIIAQVEKVSAPMREQYQAEKQVLEQQAKKQAQQEQLENALSTLRQLLSNSVFENVSIDEHDISTQLHNLTEQTKNSLLSDDTKQRFFKEIEQLFNRLSQLPQIADAVAEATRLVSSLSGIALPEKLEDLNPLQERFNDWQTEWKRNADLIDNIFPQSIESAYSELKTHWLNALKPLKQAQKRDFLFCQKKLGELKRLIISGKYRSALGLNKKLNSLRETLSPAQLQQLERDFNWVDAKVSDLNDWETYIATPRKQALIDEARQLAETPEQDPRRQAESVKGLRKRWNMLGHAEESVDKEYNQTFNEYCEQAFAPCRVYFSELENQREKHLTERKNIISEIVQLADTLPLEQPLMAKLDSDFQSVVKKWRKAGEVDRNAYKSLVKSYEKAIKPLKQALNQYHNENKLAKEGLIASAQKVAENDDIYAMVNTLKDLQSQWKAIGYAGHKYDNALWAAFRSINNEAFKKRDQVKSLEQANLAQELLGLQQRFDSIEAQAAISKEPPLIAEQVTLLNEVLEQVAQLDKRHVLLSQCKKLLKALNNQLKNATKQQEKEQYLELFNLVEALSQNSVEMEDLESDKRFQTLSHRWQKVLIQSIEKNLDNDAQLQLTLEMEIIAGVASPAEFEQERMATQVAILAEKMATQQGTSLEQKLESWLKCGVLTGNKLATIDRVKALFI